MNVNDKANNANVGQPNANNMPFSPTAVEQRNLFTYKARKMNIINEATSPYSLTPISAKSVKLLRSPRKASRKISKIPFKVLDAPELQDDFYLNLVDWSSQNVLSVGLGARVYLWSACTSQVTNLCDLTTDNDTVTSVSWSERVSLTICNHCWIQCRLFFFKPKLAILLEVGQFRLEICPFFA